MIGRTDAGEAGANDENIEDARGSKWASHFEVEGSVSALVPLGIPASWRGTPGLVPEQVQP